MSRDSSAHTPLPVTHSICSCDLSVVFLFAGFHCLSPRVQQLSFFLHLLQSFRPKYGVAMLCCCCTLDFLWTSWLQGRLLSLRSHGRVGYRRFRCQKGWRSSSVSSICVSKRQLPSYRVAGKETRSKSNDEQNKGDQDADEQLFVIVPHGTRRCSPAGECSSHWQTLPLNAR